MSLKWVALAAVIFVATAAVLGAAYVVPASAAPAVREYTVKASQFTYEPNVIEVNRGDRVIFHIDSVDVAHGIYLDVYGLNVHVQPGKTETVEFIADKVGTYRLRCSVTCGPMHPFMIGEVKVSPNAPFGAVLGLTAATGLGSVAYIWRRKEDGHGTGA